MKKAVLALLLILAALALAACGGGSSGSSAEQPSGGTVEAETEGEAEAEGGTAGTGAAIAIEANPEGQLAFEEKEVTAKAGKDTVDFTNPSSVPHNVTIENEAGEQLGETETLAEGNSSTSVELEPGTYTFYCSVPGHREAGMEGTIVVK